MTNQEFKEFVTHLRSATRKIWMFYSADRKQVIANSKIGRGIHRCEQCKKVVHYKLIKADHIVKCSPVNGFQTFMDFGPYLERLFNCGIQGLMAICKDCHDVKTKLERAPVKKKSRKKLSLKRRRK